MSAWIVSKTHIDALVQAGIEREMVREGEADEFGKMLWGENLASIHYRYPDTVEGGGYPGPIGFVASDVDAYTYEPLDGEAGITLRSEGVVHMASSCYDYQTCEHPEYEGSKAEQFAMLLSKLTEAAGREGPWGIDTRDAFIVSAGVRA